MNTTLDADIDEALRLAYPQGTALIRPEHGIEILNLGARQLIANPEIALQVLGPRGVGKLGRALLAVGQKDVAVAERMIELAEESGGDRASTPARAKLRPGSSKTGGGGG